MIYLFLKRYKSLIRDYISLMARLCFYYLLLSNLRSFKIDILNREIISWNENIELNKVYVTEKAASEEGNINKENLKLNWAEQFNYL